MPAGSGAARLWLPGHLGVAIRRLVHALGAVPHLGVGAFTSEPDLQLRKGLKIPPQPQ